MRVEKLTRLMSHRIAVIGILIVCNVLYLSVKTESESASSVSYCKYTLNYPADRVSSVLTALNVSTLIINEYKLQYPMLTCNIS